MQFKGYRKYILYLLFFFSMATPCSAQLGQGFLVINYKEKYTIDAYTIVDDTINNKSDWLKLDIQSIRSVKKKMEVSLNLYDLHKLKNTRNVKNLILIITYKKKKMNIFITGNIYPSGNYELDLTKAYFINYKIIIDNNNIEIGEIGRNITPLLKKLND